MNEFNGLRHKLRLAEGDSAVAAAEVPDSVAGASGAELLAVKGIAPMVWQVGALCRAVASALDVRFNPVAVQGEITGFSRAASGHCYFSVKDEAGQIRCAMFRRAASLLDFSPRDGQRVELRGRLGVYEQRGDLQLVVESMRPAGQGALFEQFLRLKAKLEAEGLFDAERKREIPSAPRCIGLVTSLGAAALHDVLTALARRAPHVPVVLAPAAVQGAGAGAALVQALSNLEHYNTQTRRPPNDLIQNSASELPVDVILLVRGGGSLEDLWSFNDEALVRAIAASSVPVISGVGHETDFTLADFAADLRAPTPTAAAELVCQPREVWLGAGQLMQQRLADAVSRRLDVQHQRIDQIGMRLGRPSDLIASQQRVLARAAGAMRHGVHTQLAARRNHLATKSEALPRALRSTLQGQQQRLAHVALRLAAIDPSRVLQRGYAWLQDGSGQALTSAAQAQAGQAVTATLADGRLDLTVQRVGTQ